MFIHIIFLIVYTLILIVLINYADMFKTKERKGKKKNSAKEKDEQTIDFEECTDSQTYATFFQMNLSKPLLKVTK